MADFDSLVSGVEQSEAKIHDLTEACERIDADLSVLASDMRELVKTQGEESKEVNSHITAFSDELEKIRRKAARPGSGGFAFESVRSGAEREASKRRDPERDKLVSLAEG